MAGSYDSEDRVQTYAGATYTHSAAGDLQTITDAAGTRTYTYDELGNLTRVVLPGGDVIEYVIDGLNRRVAKKHNGAVVQRWLYRNTLQIAAELDANGEVSKRFVYASRTIVPDFMTTPAGTYRIVTDHLGSVRLVVDAVTGAVAQRLDYDEFGDVFADTNPGLQTFGFAGGLHDADAQFFRFGARDYDPHTGRWTAKDPIGFEGGSANLYGYSFNDPVNFIDPTGTVTIPGVGWVNAGENSGAQAVAAYADTLTNPNAAWYEKGGAAVGGFFAALWTPQTSDATVATLGAACGVNAYVGRAFWQYYPANNPAYHSRWLTRGPGWKPPHALGQEAVEKLALPPYNPATGVRQVPNSWNQFVGGPGRVGPAYGQPGGGTQYLTGGWPR